MAEYDAQAIEAKWQERWEEEGVFRAIDLDATRPKYYMLEMLPYPSGTMHMGHMRNYTIGDAVARYKRMRGFNVLHPMGWDAFGLPAENAAIKNGVHPRAWTNGNIDEFRRVLRRFGFSYDWTREISTCEPEYYRWNQWFFLRMLEKGIAFRKKSKVNWCPACNTVLANEQVINGYCWRHEDVLVESRELEQWFLRITQYADELLDDMKQLEGGGWPERVLAMQRNWIGKSQGARVRFDVEEVAGLSLEVFTTRVDTIYGASALLIAAGHPKIAELLAGVPGGEGLQEQLKAMQQRSVKAEELATAEKEGFFTGRYAVNPFSAERVPIWVANFVLAEYGTGAVMCVPAHDERDFEFAQKFHLPVKVVVQPPSGEPLRADQMKEAYTEYGSSVNSGSYSGLATPAAIEKMTADAKSKGFGYGETTYRLRDWGISRQRYWGTPIPVIYCDKDGIVPVPDDQLPVKLPPDVKLTGEGQSPLATDPDFVNVKCPKCGGPARRETDTMDTFVDSSWYYMRYCCPDAATMVDKRTAYWMPMDQYIGGIEHAVLHLLYARFWTRVMRDLGLVSFDEPFERLFTQGMLLAHCYYREDASGRKRWFYPAEVEQQFDERGAPVSAIAKEDGQPVLYGGIEKMSKSKNNVVEPGAFIERFGADTARAFVMFAGPPDQSAPWSDASAEGVHRFLRRLWSFSYGERTRIEGAASLEIADLDAGLKKIRHELHAALHQARFDY
ncbi:MAG TPA: leucine--tRNA ligase, partial [Candidatus Acidoferrum sp.]|nr:leucine--tRNA ligase [Candidatus Acidoferrum sp.]